MNLGLDHPNRTAEASGHFSRFLRGIGGAAARHRNAILLEKRFGLVFVYVHEKRRKLWKIPGVSPERAQSNTIDGEGNPPGACCSAKGATRGCKIMFSLSMAQS
jgi:hypothetical protein